ncbi:MAG: hypothetical protein KDD34_00205 [Bdellovibrionales bacterium]|nr:hypothetical protein [Bdellovibrionales bacterium]
MIVHSILYVSDQKKSCEFYAHVLGQSPRLDVPGMTEFQLNSSHVLGLMPEKGIKTLLGEKMPDPCLGAGIPRVELYIRIENPEDFLNRAIDNGAILISPILNRNWGDRAGYVMDFDGHILAFAGEGSMND